VAPETAQGTALEEDGRPDARPIVDRVALDVENLACHAKSSAVPVDFGLSALYLVVIYQISDHNSSTFLDKISTLFP
jgi:translation elongation factor EF-1beta